MWECKVVAEASLLQEKTGRKRERGHNGSIQNLGKTQQSFAGRLESCQGHLVASIRSETPHTYPQQKPHMFSFFLLKTKAKPFNKWFSIALKGFTCGLEKFCSYLIFKRTQSHLSICWPINHTEEDFGKYLIVVWLSLFARHNADCLPRHQLLGSENTHCKCSMINKFI